MAEQFDILGHVILQISQPSELDRNPTPGLEHELSTSERIHECCTLLTRSIPAKTCLPPPVHGHSAPAPRRGSLIRLLQPLVSSLDPRHHRAEGARTTDHCYQTRPIVQEASPKV